MPRPASDPPTQADIRRRILAEATDNHAPEPGSAAAARSSRNGDMARTPLPGEVLPVGDSDGLAQLQRENVELRQLIEQAIAQEEENERKSKEWLAEVANLRAQVELFHSSDAEGWLAQVQHKDDQIQSLARQLQELQSAPRDDASADQEQYLHAIRERDQLIDALSARVAELEELIANAPPPAPTDEELARMADELEQERCQITQLRKELEEEKDQHLADMEDFERQGREMEVAMSKERAELARQRMELHRLQAEINAELEAVHRGDSALKDKIASLHRRGDASSDSTPAVPAKVDKDSGFMRRFFGK